VSSKQKILAKNVNTQRPPTTRQDSMHLAFIGSKPEPRNYNVSSPKQVREINLLPPHLCLEAGYKFSSGCTQAQVQKAYTATLKNDT
jgi:hypothetical protein